jgi:hypothetical protein
MTNVQKKSLRELCELDRGITYLMTSFNFMDSENVYDDDIMFDVFKVAQLQQDIQKEIEDKLFPEGGKNENK